MPHLIALCAAKSRLTQLPERVAIFGCRSPAFPITLRHAKPSGANTNPRVHPLAFAPTSHADGAQTYSATRSGALAIEVADNRRRSRTGRRTRTSEKDPFRTRAVPPHQAHRPAERSACAHPCRICLPRLTTLSESLLPTDQVGRTHGAGHDRSLVPHAAIDAPSAALDRWPARRYGQRDQSRR